MDLYTLKDDDATILQVIDVLNLGLPIAEQAEVISPENIHAIKTWIKTERFRLRPEPAQAPATLDHLQSSQFFEFWNTLEKDQEVRWTQTKKATYFVVDGDLVRRPPERYLQGPGPWVELRRHTGKTFWSHIACIRPLNPVSEEPAWWELTDSEEQAEERTWD